MAVGGGGGILKKRCNGVGRRGSGSGRSGKIGKWRGRVWRKGEGHGEPPLPLLTSRLSLAPQPLSSFDSGSASASDGGTCGTFLHATSVTL